MSVYYIAFLRGLFSLFVISSNPWSNNEDREEFRREQKESSVMQTTAATVSGVI